MPPRNVFACAFMPVNIHAYQASTTVNSSLAWALFNASLCCKTGLETRSYDRLQTGTGVILSLMSLSKLVSTHTPRSRD